MSILRKATKAVLDEADYIRADIWEDTLRRAQANLRIAGEEHGFSRQRAYVLTQRHGLQALADELRAERRHKKQEGNS